MRENLKQYFDEHKRAMDLFLSSNELPRVVESIILSLKSGGTLYAFGNGGSAADASHFVAELVGRFEVNRTPYRAICLNSDTALLTALANDYGYEHIFERQVSAFVNRGDIVVGFSTSGRSANVVKGLERAHNAGAITGGFTGDSISSPILSVIDYNIAVSSQRTCIIQEIHQMAIHFIASQVEKELK